MEEICRVCMGTTGAFTNIFDETQEWDTCIADMISECTGYMVRRGDSLPENICPPCLEDAVSAFNLKKSCEQSHKLYFARMEEDKEEEICDNVEDDDWVPSDSERQWTKYAEFAWTRLEHSQTFLMRHKNGTPALLT
ncbi:uncharacterized zinc finger protein CG2678-like [Drosophila obscura]|uniref:uncharacterized zinc finger protein CG2678-like n=1 Tax=Drosophila obscura TaxID=7282 RepID=UPI001BB1DD68|nr:uncharacterized zinc finger protein CG2678-like [Drosophila obscura]